MPPLPKAGAQLDLDTSAWDAAFKGAMADAGKLDALNPEIKVGVSDSEIKTAIGLAADLDTSTSLKVNVDDGELTTASDQLDDIATIGAIDLAINIAGNAQGFIEGLGRFSGIGGLMEMDGALALIEARTGRMIPNAEKLITDLYTNGWGASRTEIAGVVAQAAQLGLEGDDLAAAVESTFHVVSVTGGDATETLNKLDIAAKANGISFTESADLFVAGYQNGGDKADDLLDTLSEYGTQFKQFGLSAEGATAFLVSGLEAGVFNADTLGDTVKELGIRLAEVGTTPAITEAFDQLDSLSTIDLSALLDGYKAGTVTGDDMLEGIFASLAEVSETDKTAATLIAAQLVGTTSEIVGTDIWGQLSTDADTVLGDIETRAEEAGNAISDTLGVTVDTFLRNIEQMATSFLESDAIDLDGKIETFKTQLQTAMTTAMEGGSLGDALEVGFGITGVDAALANIGRVFGQFTITLLEIVAAIQDPLNINDADAGTRGQITNMATAQLPFDLQVANPDEFDAILKQASERGVSLADLGSALGTAMETSIADGDFDRANEIINEQIANATTSESVQPFVDKWTALIDESLAAKQEELQGLTGGITPFSLDGFDAQVAAFNTGMETAIAAETPTAEMLWASLWEVPEEVTTSFSDLETDVDTAMTNASLVTSLASQEMIDALSAMSDGVVTADEEIAYAITGNTMTTSFEAMATSADENVEATKASFKGLLATVSQVDVAMSAFFNGIMAKVSAVNSAIEGIGTVPTGGGGGNNTTNNINVNQTNNVQGNAQANQAGYAIAETIRGMA